MVLRFLWILSVIMWKTCTCGAHTCATWRFLLYNFLKVVSSYCAVGTALGYFMIHSSLYFSKEGTKGACKRGKTVTYYGRCNAVPVVATVYAVCSFQMPNVLLPYILSGPLGVAPMGTRPIQCECLFEPISMASLEVQLQEGSSSWLRRYSCFPWRVGSLNWRWFW